MTERDEQPPASPAEYRPERKIEQFGAPIGPVPAPTQPGDAVALEISNIEDAIAQNKLTSAQVFTKMRQLLYAAASAKAQWQPIETAPKDNKIPLLLARFNDDGSLQSIDYNGIWESDRESWEIPERYWYWASAHGNVEEPSHWMYQPEWYAHLPAAASERGGSDER